MSSPAIEAFAGQDAMAEAAVALIVQALEPAGLKSLLVTGGSSPGLAYDRLATLDLGWDRVTVTLSDDRWVDEASPLSNAALVRQRLLTGRAAAARFLPLKGQGLNPEADAIAIEPVIAALMPFAASLLGMGDDGHIASLFPGEAGVSGGLDPRAARLCVGVPVAGLEPFVPRITLTLPALLATGRIILQISGTPKRTMVERVLAEPDYDLPVGAILRQDRAPVSILWAP